MIYGIAEAVEFGQSLEKQPELEQNTPAQLEGAQVCPVCGGSFASQEGPYWYESFQT